MVCESTIVYSQHTACCRGLIAIPDLSLGLSSKVDAALCHANYLFDYRLFCLPFLLSFCILFSRPLLSAVANRNIRLKFHM